MHKIQLDFTAHMQGIHYTTHQTNRVMQALSKLNMELGKSFIICLEKIYSTFMWEVICEHNKIF
jgi:hypothetical protein